MSKRLGSNMHFAEAEHSFAEYQIIIVGSAINDKPTKHEHIKTGMVSIHQKPRQAPANQNRAPKTSTVKSVSPRPNRAPRNPSTFAQSPPPPCVHSQQTHPRSFPTKMSRLSIVNGKKLTNQLVQWYRTPRLANPAEGHVKNPGAMPRLIARGCPTYMFQPHKNPRGNHVEYARFVLLPRRRQIGPNQPPIFQVR